MKNVLRWICFIPVAIIALILTNAIVIFSGKHAVSALLAGETPYIIEFVIKVVGCILSSIAFIIAGTVIIETRKDIASLILAIVFTLICASGFTISCITGEIGILYICEEIASLVSVWYAYFKLSKSDFDINVLLN